VKISIIVPVYNGEDTIEECLDALINQNYLKKNYEIILVDDASIDRTPEIVRNLMKNVEELGLSFKYVRNLERKGRLLTRTNGAKEATHDLLLFIDSRCIAHQDLLRKIEEINYEPIVGNPLMKSDNSISRFYLLVRKRFYGRHFGERFEPIYIEKENFDRIGKGTGIFICNKELFLLSQPESRSVYVSDDTKLLWNVVQKKKILKHPDVKAAYLPRHCLKEEIEHTLQRGPKFVDYYLDISKKNFWIFIALPFILLILTVSLLLTNFTYFLYWLYILAFAYVSLSVLLAKNIKDFFIIMALLPVVGLAFEIGILKGVTLKMLEVIRDDKRIFL